MPEADVQNPGQDSAGEAVEPTAPATEPSSDPLDAIQDPEARAEAKKHRAIARRLEGKKEPEAPATAPLPAYASKEDLAKIVTHQAKDLVSAEVREAWDELSNIPLEGYDATDARSIARNMTERLAIYKERKVKSDPAKDLATSSGEVGTAGKTPEVKKSGIVRPLDIDAQAERLYGKS